MIEVLVAAMSGLCVWVVLNVAEHGDQVVAARVGALRPQAPVEPRSFRARAMVCLVGRRFPSRKPVQLDPSTPSITTELVRGAQVSGAAAGFVIGLMAGPLALLVSPVFGWVGYRLPRIWLVRRIARRREQAAAALPDALDLMAVCTHAGLNVALTLKRVATRSRGALGQELTRTVEEIELGVPRQVALRALAQRNPNGDLEALVGVLEHSERFGTQVSASLESFSAEVRARRRRSAEEQARKAPIKMLFPLVFLILPAFVLLSVVPLLLSTFASLGF